MKLSNRKFKLIENKKGLASGETIMVFDNTDLPYKAIYNGPNIEYGHVLVSLENENLTMLYHSLSRDGELSAGKATVTLSKINSGNLEMQLDWHWLTGNLSSGISKWCEIIA
ncbi:MAG: hypothetical protein V7749_05760 [Cocleimonas sp.]